MRWVLIREIRVIRGRSRTSDGGGQALVQRFPRSSAARVWSPSASRCWYSCTNPAARSQSCDLTRPVRRRCSSTRRVSKLATALAARPTAGPPAPPGTHHRVRCPGTPSSSARGASARSPGQPASGPRAGCSGWRPEPAPAGRECRGGSGRHTALVHGVPAHPWGFRLLFNQRRNTPELPNYGIAV
jgi:hypothetical protein